MILPVLDRITIDLNGIPVEIAYFIRRGDRETLLYLHGLGSTRYDFFEALHRPEFATYTLVAMSLPGSGQSSYPSDTALDIADVADITHAVIEALTLCDVTVIGHSLGGITGTLLLQRHPEVVKRFINIEGNLTPEDTGMFSRRTVSYDLDGFIASGYLDEILAGYAELPYIGPRIFADTTKRNVSARVFYDYCVSIIAHSDGGQLLPAFTTPDIPRMFVYGEANEGLSYLETLREHGIVVSRIPNAHHWPFFDNRDAYYPEIAKFIAET